MIKFKRKFLIFLFSFPHLLTAQIFNNGVIKTLEIEIIGRPTWQKIIPLGNEGLLLFVKKDITKAVIYKFDSDLKKLWESEIFLDAEHQPTSYSINNQIVTFVFSENQGMYYQVFNIDLSTGKFENNGFELKEYFHDQDFVFFKQRILMVGLNEKGASFYNFDFNEDNGDFIPANIDGKTQIQYLKYNTQNRLVETLWSVKVAGFNNEKKRKGEFIKDAFVVFAQYDTAGKLLLKTTIPSSAGNFPLTATLTHFNSSTNIITGTYQSNTGAKGIYFSKIEDNKTTITKFYDYKMLLTGNPVIEEEVFKKLLKNFNFNQSNVVINKNILTVGGGFYQAKYELLSSSNPYYNSYNPNYSNVGNIQNYNYPSAKSKQIFKGYNYLNGLVANFDLEGNLLSQTKVEMNQISPQLDETIAISETKSVAVCVKGNVFIGNYLGFSNKKIAKLSDENADLKNTQFIASYHGVRNWYENYFIADGSRIKFEAIKEMDAPKTKSSKRKKGQQPLPQTNIKKIIYLSKIQGFE